MYYCQVSWRRSYLAVYSILTRIIKEVILKNYHIAIFIEKGLTPELLGHYFAGKAYVSRLDYVSRGASLEEVDMQINSSIFVFI